MNKKIKIIAALSAFAIVVILLLMQLFQEPPAPPKTNNQVVPKIQFGSYSGGMEIEGKVTNGTTNIVMDGDVISGTYSYGAFSGVLTDCRLDKHTLSCRWVENNNASGTFVAIFNDDYSSFIGMWDYTGGKNGGYWSGRR